MTVVRFVAADLKTGVVRGELPLAPTAGLSRLLSNVGAGRLDLPVTDPACPPEWERWTKPWRALIVAVDESYRIVWSGVVSNRRRGHGPVVALDAVSVEGYLDQVYVPDLTFAADDQTSVIAAALAQVAIDDDGIAMTVDCPASGVVRDRVYAADENARVLGRVQELAAVDDGFEWMIDVAWSDQTRTAFTLTFRTGYPNLGTVVADPVWRFECPGSVVGFELTEPGPVTRVKAWGDESNDVRISSVELVDTDTEALGWPRVEYRETFPGVSVQATIDAHGAGLATARYGTARDLLALQVRADVDPLFGSYSLGDTAWFTSDTDALTGTSLWRVIGWGWEPGASAVSPYLMRVVV